MTAARTSATSSSVREHWTTSAALVIAIAVVIARAMQLETLRDPFDVTLGGEPTPRGPGPATGLLLDLLSCVPTLLILLRRAIDRTFTTSTTVAHVLLFALVAWTGASASWATDKFAATIASAGVISAGILIWSFSQLVRRWWQLRLVAGVCFGLLLVYAAHGLIYKYVELPPLRESVEENWTQILAERGWEPGSFAAEQFKKKIMGGEMIGFGASPNTYAAMLVMLSLISAGLALQRWRDRDEWGWIATIAIALVPAAFVLWLTNSRTALLTPIIGALLFTVAWNLRDWIARHRALVYWSGVGAVMLVIVAVVAHGAHHGSLFHDSLTFRWRYWTGAFSIFKSHPWLGVGFDNFSAYYLGARLPIASEEVRDPHNFIVRFFVETGIIGGAVLLLWLARLWWEITCPKGADTESPSGTATQPLRLIVTIAGLAIGLNIIPSIDLSQNAAYVFIELLKRLLYLGLIVIGCVVGVIESTARQERDDRPAAMLLLAVGVAIAIFFLHNLIDFSMFETGPMFVFAMLIGAVLGMRTAKRSAGWRWSIVPATVLWLAGAIGVVVPVIIAESSAQAGDSLLRAHQPRDAAERFDDATALWIPNADYPRRAARALIYAQAPVERIREALDYTVEVDPMNLSARHLRANFEMNLPAPDRARAMADFTRLIELNPNDVQTRLDYAAALEGFGDRASAADELERALRFNDMLHPDEPKRLPAARVQEIRQRIDKLKQSTQAN